MRLESDTHEAWVGLDRAYLKITSHVLSLGQIVDLVGEEPDEGFSFGDPFINPGMSATRNRTFSSWRKYSSAPRSATIQESLDGLVEVAKRVSTRVGGRQDIDCELQIVQYLHSDREAGFGLSPEWLQILASMPAGIDVDQYR
ncbi:DUF4279 domain-containing protein [Microbacterium sp. 22179]|uniref:DUF4279 domain-containing protein n=1 Tax=Microbacterium sp. 22179 TaxID=3453886 RepID=UPI003F849574